MSRLRLICLLAMLAVGACQTVPPSPGTKPASVAVEEIEPWRRIAAARDAAALDALGEGWDQALAAARGSGLTRRVAAEGVLLMRGAGLARAAPPPGSYRCRYVRLGTRKWTASAPAFCYVGVEKGQLSLATELRGLRLGGYLWEIKSGGRLVFLGAAVPAGGKSVPAYGDDPAADSAGLVERIGEFRYRLTLPEAAPGAGLTVVEMVAAPRP